MKPLLPFRRCALFAALLLGAPALAGAVTITREFSASWFDPSHSGHGFSLEVMPGAQGKTLIAYWFTYDADGKQIWVVGSGPVVGNSATVSAFVTRGGRFDNGFDPAAVSNTPWGTLTFTFSDCASGSVRFAPSDPRLPGGTLPLSRLTSLYDCSGGISDDRSTRSDDARIVQFERGTAALPALRAKLAFSQRSTRTDFRIELEGASAGDYRLRVGGIDRGTLAIASGTGSAEVEFRSPAEAGHPLLDFDPRGQRIEILRNGAAVLAATLTSGTTASSASGSGGTAAAPLSGRYVLKVQPAGHDGPELRAELEGRSGRAEFTVEAEDVPVGSYRIRVGGVDRGAVTVTAVPGGTHGELEFRNPADAGQPLLDFDPRGQGVELVGSVSLGGLFPTTPSTDGSTGDDHGGGSDDPPGDDHGGGNDDPPGDDHGGGNDDPPGDDHGGGNDDPPGDDHGGGNDDPPGDDHGGGNDDPPGDDGGGHGGGHG